MAVDGEKQEETVKPPAVLLSTETVKGCNDSLARAMKDGVIKRRPYKGRIDVDDYQWLLADADDKRAVIALVSCADHGKKLTDLDEGTLESVTVYGARSGKRVASGAGYGVIFD
jgi:hypothetical protein